MMKAATECDLVMKGGITSGIVYPSVALALKNDPEHGYTFRNIGGTSAGAIAAVGIAAAEYNPEGRGYEILRDDVENWLGAEQVAGQGSNLQHLFQENEQTRPLMNILNAFLAANAVKAAKRQVAQTEAQKKAISAPYLSKLLGTWLRSYPMFTKKVFWGAILGVILAVLLPLAIYGVVDVISPSAAEEGRWVFLAVIVVFGIVGLWLGLQVGGVIGAITALPANLFGICSGHAENTGPGPQALTDWLSGMIDKLAGLTDGTTPSTRPLTFGDLSKKEGGKPIELMMITSNLSHGLPYVLPKDLHNFIFREDEMRKLFPGYIVEHLIKYTPDEKRANKTILRQEDLTALTKGGYYFFPDEKHIPVVVGARLSMSFPFLLAAVPLYTVSTLSHAAYVEWVRKGRPQAGISLELQKNWFSDGGISSNFPIQFFDAWLPGRPTFGVNLTKLGSATSSLQDVDPEKQGKPVSQATKAIERGKTVGTKDALPVFLPQAEEPQDPEWKNIDGLLPLARAIFSTAQNYRDTLQMNLPSYRERTVQIRLDDDEGGLNLSMSKQIIEQVIAKGQRAGEMLSGFEFEPHLWVRFLVLMNQLEVNIGELQKVVGQQDSPLLDIEALLARPFDGGTDPRQTFPYWHEKDETWCKGALARIKALQQLITDWDIEPYNAEKLPAFFHLDAPLPEPVLRVTPEV